jgi:hypothetical protein
MCASAKWSWPNWGFRWIAFLMKPLSPAFVGRCPQACIRANKRLSTKTGQGKRWLRQALMEAANAAAREPGHLVLWPLPSACASAWGTRKRWWLWLIASRSSSLICGSEHQSSRELGPDHLDEKAALVAKRRALRTLEQLGYDVALQSSESA